MTEHYHSTGWSWTVTPLLFSLDASQLSTKTVWLEKEKRSLQLRQWKETHKTRNPLICQHFANHLKPQQLIYTNIFHKHTCPFHCAIWSVPSEWSYWAIFTFFLNGDEVDNHLEHKFCWEEEERNSSSIQRYWPKYVLKCSPNKIFGRH